MFFLLGIKRKKYFADIFAVSVWVNVRKETRVLCVLKRQHIKYYNVCNGEVIMKVLIICHAACAVLFAAIAVTVSLSPTGANKRGHVTSPDKDNGCHMSHE